MLQYSADLGIEVIFEIYRKPMDDNAKGGLTQFLELLRWLVFDPWPLCKTEVHLKMSDHKMLTFLVRKEIIDNNNSLVAISLSEVGENEFLPNL